MVKLATPRRESSYFYPVRFRVWIADEISEDNLEFLGLEFTETLDQHLRQNLSSSAKLRYVHSQWGSVDNFTLLEIDPFDAFADTFAEYAALKIIAKEIANCFESGPLKGKIQKYSVGVSSPIQSSQIPDLSHADSEFEWRRMEELRSRVIMPIGSQAGDLNLPHQVLANTEAKVWYKEYSSYLAVGFLLLLLSWNVFQEYLKNRRDAEILQKLDGLVEAANNDHKTRMAVSPKPADPAEHICRNPSP